MRWIVLCWLLLAGLAQASPLKMIFPGIASTLEQGGYTHNLGNDTLFCWTVPAPYTVVGMTKLAAKFAATSAVNASIAIFPDDDSAPPLAFKTGLAVTGVFGATGLPPVTYTGGMLYRLCHCASTGGQITWVMVQQATSCCQDVNVTQIMSAFHPTYVGRATNPCSAGVLPANTGAIIADTTTPGRNQPRMPIFLVEE